MATKLYINQQFLEFIEVLSTLSKIENMQQISYQLSIPRRRMYYYLADLNHFLKANQIREIKRVDESLQITAQQRQFLRQISSRRHEVEYVYRPKERQLIVAINILVEGHQIYLSDIMKALRISRNTALADIKAVRYLIRKINELIIIQSNKARGYYVMGTELERRKLVYHLVSKLTVYKPNLTSGYVDRILWKYEPSLIVGQQTRDLFRAIDGVLPKLSEVLGKSLSFKDQKIVRATCFLLVQRMQRKIEITWSAEESYILEQFVEYKASQQIIDQLNIVLSCHIERSESYFITVILLGAHKDVDAHNKSDNFAEIQKVACLMIDHVELYSGVYFEHKQALQEQLVTHIKALFYRNKYGIAVENTMTQQIQEHYPDIYRITQDCSKYLLQYLGLNLTSGEVAYLAAHFGGQLIAYANQKYQPRIVLVTNCGVGFKEMFYQQIQQILPNFDIVATISSEETIKCKETIDFCITTETNYTFPQGQTLVVSIILTTSDIWRLFSICKKDVSDAKYPKIAKRLGKVFKKYALDETKLTPECIHDIFATLHDVHESSGGHDVKNLAHYLPQDHIFVCDRVGNPAEIVDILAAPLLDKQIISAAYSEKLKEQFQMTPLSLKIADDCLLLYHHYKYGSFEPAISLLYVEEGCLFSSMLNGVRQNITVHTFFCIATSYTMQHIPIIMSVDTALKNNKIIELLADTKDTLLQKHFI